MRRRLPTFKVPSKKRRPVSCAFRRSSASVRRRPSWDGSTRLARTSSRRWFYGRITPKLSFHSGSWPRRQDRFQEAASLFANAAVRDPSLSEALVELGVVYEILGRHEEAADACWRAVTVRPEDQGALLCLGVARYHLGLYQGAAQAFEAVIERDPDNTARPVRTRIGQESISKITKARWNEYLALNPLDPELAMDLRLRIPVAELAHRSRR